MSARMDVVNRARAAIDSAVLVSTASLLADEEEIERAELPVVVVDWVSDAIDDDGTTSQDGSSLQIRVLELSVTNHGLVKSDVESVADALESVIYREFEWADFSSAEQDKSTPEGGDRTIYSVGATFRVQYERKIER